MLDTNTNHDESLNSDRLMTIRKSLKKKKERKNELNSNFRGSPRKCASGLDKNTGMPITPRDNGFLGSFMPQAPSLFGNA